MQEQHTSGAVGVADSRIERILHHVIEWPACVLVVVEVALLFIGILARGVFHKPIIWADELASILFLWLAMFGAVIAVQRSEHMRLTFFISALSPRGQDWVKALSAGAVALFFAIILHPALEYVEDQAFV